MQRVFNVPVCDRFFQLIHFDKRLRQSIKSLHLNWRSDGLVASFDLYPEHAHWFSSRLVKVAAYLSSLANLFAIQVNYPKRLLTYLFEDLKTICPQIEQVKTMGDRIHAGEIIDVNAKKFVESLLAYHERRCSVFIVGTDGIYQKISIHNGTKSKIDPARMIGKPMAQFIGSETARYLVGVIELAHRMKRTAYAQYRVVYADSERRDYTADVIPIPDTETAVLLVNRIKD